MGEIVGGEVKTEVGVARIVKSFAQVKETLSEELGVDAFFNLFDGFSFTSVGGG
jgi:hypothetical protein